MARRAGVDRHLLLRGAGLDDIAASARDRRLAVGRMDVFLHFYSPFKIWGDIIPIEAHMTQQVVYEYTLPEKVIKENCNIVAIVSEKGEVIQAAETRIITEQ